MSYILFTYIILDGHQILFCDPFHIYISPVADFRFYYRKHVQTKCPFDSKIKLQHTLYSKEGIVAIKAALTITI